MAYERLSASDVAFLRIETPHEPQHVGSLSVLEGGPLRTDDGSIRFAELRNHIARRTLAVPRLRQKLMEVPHDVGRPVWVDDADFDIDYHVRLTSLPRPGDDGQLMTLHGRLQSQHLDRSRPLWEMWVVDGLEDDRVGLVIKTHHALGDGIANVDLALALVDLEPEVVPDANDVPPAWKPRPGPSRPRLWADSVWDLATRPVRLTQGGVRALLDPRPVVDTTVGALRTAAKFLVPRDPAPWNRPVTPHRRWVHADVPMQFVDRVRRHEDVTINDVVLTACAGALREFLVEVGDRSGDRELDAMVPVSVRADDEHGDTLGNRISMVMVALPTDLDDPLERLAAVHERASDIKGSNLVKGTETILRLADGVTPIAGPLTRFVSRRIPMNLVITNIPGPPVPLYLFGARIERTYPYVEVIDGEGLTVAVVSYDGSLYFGLTGDRDVLAELGDLAAGIEEHFARLADAVEAAAEG